MKKIMFVCTGNICRSAMAHWYMKKRVTEIGEDKNIEIFSAGTNTRTGDHATEYAIKVIEKYGVNMSEHRAVYIAESNIANMDLIVCMTKSHARKVIENYPDKKDKIFVLKKYVGVEGYTDIDDPWGLSYNVYKKTAEEIVKCVDKLIEKVV